MESVLRGAGYFCGEQVLEETFAREDFDVIHVHHPVLIGKVAAYLSRKYNIPLVYTYHPQY